MGLQKSQPEKKYAVESFYNYNEETQEDYCAIFPATPEAFEHNGDNWTGRADAYRLDLYENLEDAVKYADYWPTSIQYDEENFSEEEKETLTKVVKKLIADEVFCKKFGKEPYTGEIKIF